MAKAEGKKTGDEIPPIHTPISYSMGILAGSVLLFLAIANIEYPWGQYGFLQVFFAYWGTFGISYITFKKLYPKRWNKDDYKYIGLDTIILFALVILASAVSTFVFNITNTERALYYLAVAVGEELFFRGYLLNVLLRSFNSLETRSGEGRKYGKITIGSLSAVVIQAGLFASIHVSYWDQYDALLTVFLGGIFLGLGYVLLRNITASVLAHFFWNLYVARNLFLTFGGSADDKIPLIVCMIGCIILILSIYYFREIKKNYETLKYFKLYLVILLMLFIIGIILILYGLPYLKLYGPAEMI